MHKRWKSSVLILLVFLTACQAAGLDCREPVARGETDKQNIILIMTDDQPPYTLEYMPTLQQELVSKGILFEHAIATTPLCCPSRASILTGEYAHNHGVLTNRMPNGGAEMFDDSSTVATWLDEAGYVTGYFGKYLNGYDELSPAGYVPPGWDSWGVFYTGAPPQRFYSDYEMSIQGEIRSFGSSAGDFSNDVITQMGVDFIRQNAAEPFFVILGYYSPHQPFGFADRHADLFRTDEQFASRRPPNFNEEDVSDKPDWVQTLELQDPNWVDQIAQRSLRSLQSVDEGIQDVLDTLDCHGIRNNTTIIYISDNGATAGDHRLANGKNCPYEGCILFPFVIVHPDLDRQNETSANIVLNIDIAPTIADIAGIEIPGSADGESLLPLLYSPDMDWREEALIEHWTGEDGGDEGALVALIPTYAGLRTERWKYVRYETGELELYDLTVDPYELENLAYRDGLQEILATLDLRLNALLEQ